MKKKASVDAKKLAAGLSAVFVSLTLLAGVLAFVFLDNPYSNQPDKPAIAPVSSQPESAEDIASDAAVESTPDQEGDLPQQEPVQPDIQPEPDPDPEPVFFNVPDEMRAVQMVAGVDYTLPGAEASPNTTAAQIDAALASAKELTMNSIIIDTVYGDKVLFDAGGLPQAAAGMDCTDYIVTRAREEGFYVYATYPVGMLGALPDGNAPDAKTIDGDVLDAVIGAAADFAGQYKLDGILLTDYYHPASGSTYAAYLQSGGGAGYEAYLKQVPQTLISTATKSMRGEAPGTQIGLLADAVWENKMANEQGSDTTADFTALGNGNADTRGMVLGGLFDFVMVQDFASTSATKQNFETVAAWWQPVAEQSGKPLYIMHASSKTGTQESGWGESEQLTKQIIVLEKLGGVSGYAFDSLAALSKNVGNAAVMLVKYLNDQINEQYVLTQLSLSKPAQLTFTTKEQTVTFQGASDPQEKVTINGEKIPTNESGYFTIKEDLKAGLNTFEISHKGKTFTYKITREVEVLKSVTPTGNLSVEGGMAVTVSALAYDGAAVTASIGGQTITLMPTEDLEDEELRSSGYVRYMGEFTAPAASASITPLGNIVVTATAQGTTMSLQGASVSVNKIASMGSGAVVQVMADQAETFPVSSLDDKSDSTYFPLPAGTLDMTYGNEVVYNNGKTTFKYWKLQSGMRVYSSDIKAVGAQLPDQNKISGMKVKSAGQYTTLTLSTAQKVPFKVSYDGSRVVFAFQYTSSVPDSASISSNALFSGASWSGSSLTLTLKKSGGFLGYKAYYDGSDLVLRFNNSPGSLKGARVMVDPGHGGKDPGALGFYPGKDEADINAAISSKLVAELKGRGATVLTTPTGGSLAARVEAARAFNPQAFVAIHCNSSATNSSAQGTEVYYFSSFSKSLAAYITANVSSAMGNTNRGAKFGLYYVTRVQQFPAVLVETGFVSNEKEYTKLINSKYQSRIAEAVANGVNSYFGGTNSGSFKQDPDDADDTSSTEREEGEGLLSSSSNKLTLSKTTLTLKAGATATLSAKLGTKKATVDWDSDDTGVAEVDENGTVTAVGSGTTTIYAVDANGQEAKCKVTVSGASSSAGSTPVDGVRVTSVTVNGTSTVDVGSRASFTGTVSPSNAQDLGIEWVSSDESVFVVSAYDDNSCKIEGIAVGTATLICSAYDDKSIKKEITITVR